MYVNITFVGVEEILVKFGIIRHFINSFISAEGLTGDSAGDVPVMNPSSGDIIPSPRFSSLSFSAGQNYILQ